MDLAVLRLDDETFFAARPPLPRAETLPGIKDTVMAYAGSELYIPNTGFAFFGDLRTHDVDNYDYRLGASYKFSNMPVKLRAGWREANVDFDNVDQRIDGWFMGGEFTF